MTKAPLQIHLIANAHLDPVWLWDWREGLNEGITTVRTILDLMDENPDLTFVRGESAIYEHIEKHDPITFTRIIRQIQAGRWDVAGGTYVQPDTNLPSAETLARHFTYAQNYFRSKFGRPVSVAWQADSFGHTAGLPEIFAAAGIDSFAFTRPDSKILPLAEPAFWWEGPGGSRILSYRPLAGWYGMERHEMTGRLDAVLEAARAHKLENVACFYGLGNHGGGPTRRHLRDIRAWAAAHPEVQVIHSGLHPFFAALRGELARRGEHIIPTHRGELNYCLRGCYSSVAKFKYLYRQTESRLVRAEATDALTSALTWRPAADLKAPWRGLLMNSFHDILPGSSIERAMDDQLAWLGSVIHASQQTEMHALNQLAEMIDTTVSPPKPDHPSAVATLVWNPHPRPFSGYVELEACMDYRVIEAYRNRPGDLPLRLKGSNGRNLPFQEIATEHTSLREVAWRKRIVVPVKLPAFGWNVLEFGWVEGARPVEISRSVSAAPGWIDNGLYRVEAKAGAKGIRVFYKGKPVFSGPGLQAAVFEDPWGSWGGMLEEPDSTRLNTVREKWTVQQVTLLEKGPLRATLWVRLAGSKSRIDLALSVSRDREAIDINARVFWDERSARLKLIMPVGGRTIFEVPAATVERGPSGEVPGGRWVQVESPDGGFGFASDALYNFDTTTRELRATIVRASRYANDVKTASQEEFWLPAVDAGELRFRCLLAPGHADLPRLSRELEQPPVVFLTTPAKGSLPRAGSLASLSPASLRLLAVKAAEDGKGFVIRVQGESKKSVQARINWLGEELDLGTVPKEKIVSWRLTRQGEHWRAVAIDLAEFACGSPRSCKK